MSLIESARDLVRSLVVQDPEVGGHDTSTRGQWEFGDSPATAGASPETTLAVDDEIEALRREWETQPGHH